MMAVIEAASGDGKSPTLRVKIIHSAAKCMVTRYNGQTRARRSHRKCSVPLVDHVSPMRSR